MQPKVQNPAADNGQVHNTVSYGYCKDKRDISNEKKYVLSFQFMCAGYKIWILQFH